MVRRELLVQHERVGDDHEAGEADKREMAPVEPAEAGCTLPEIVSITGHTLRRAQDILDKYLARTSKLAASAIAKFENVTETESAKRLAK